MAFASLNNDRFCRTYEGSLPVLGVTDPEIVREVMIKQFDVFPNRTTRTSPAIKYMRKMIVIMQHDEWRRTRSALSPTFTGAKLKKMVAVMNDVASNFSRKLSSLSSEEIENIQLKPIFRAYTMDVICNVVFGFKIDTQVFKIVFSSKRNYRETKQSSTSFECTHSPNYYFEKFA